MSKLNRIHNSLLFQIILRRYVHSFNLANTFYDLHIHVTDSHMKLFTNTKGSLQRQVIYHFAFVSKIR